MLTISGISAYKYEYYLGTKYQFSNQYMKFLEEKIKYASDKVQNLVNKSKGGSYSNKLSDLRILLSDNYQIVDSYGNTYRFWAYLFCEERESH